MSEKIDILIATYNGEKYLAEQIDSILGQTYQNIKIIISDDCSKDGTREILKGYEQDERIDVYYQDKNLGYVKNFEFLLSKVEDNYFMLSDQDDVWKKEKIEKSYKTLVEKDAIMAFADLTVVDENLNIMYKSFNDYMKLTRKIKKYLNDYRFQYLYNCVTGCTVIAKKELIEKTIPIPTTSKYAIHDMWIGMMAILNGKVAYIDDQLIFYRQHGNNQVGTEKISHGFTKLDQTRELFINVKLGLFETYVNNNDKFPEELQELNIKALEYFKDISKKKYFNLKKWSVFHKLYKNETFSYYILSFLIMNMPGISRILFKIRLFLKNIMRGKK
jgi:rhamnosyltransferase